MDESVAVRWGDMPSRAEQLNKRPKAIEIKEGHWLKSPVCFTTQSRASPERPHTPTARTSARILCGHRLLSRRQMNVPLFEDVTPDMLRMRMAVAWRLEYDDVLYIMPVPVRGFGRGPATRGRARGDGERERAGLGLLGESVGERVGERGLYG